MRTGSPPELRPQKPRCFGLIAKFSIRFIHTDHRAGAGRKSTIRIQSDAFGWEMLECLMHPAGYGFCGVDSPRRNIEAAEADFQVRAQLAENGHVPGLGRSEFHREVMHFEPI